MCLLLGTKNLYSHSETQHGLIMGIYYQIIRNIVLRIGCRLRLVAGLLVMEIMMMIKLIYNDLYSKHDNSQLHANLLN